MPAVVLFGFCRDFCRFRLLDPSDGRRRDALLHRVAEIVEIRQEQLIVGIFCRFPETIDADGLVISSDRDE